MKLFGELCADLPAFAIPEVIYYLNKTLRLNNHNFFFTKGNCITSIFPFLLG